MSDETGPVLSMPFWLRCWITACVVGVFGPYVVSGLRTEQLVIYASAAAVVLAQAPRLASILRPTAVVLGLWVAYAGVAVTAGVLVSNRTPWQSGSLVAGIDNALLPLACIVTFGYWTSVTDSVSVVRVVSWVLAWAMAVNAAVALATTYVGLDAVPGIGQFWAAGGADESVAVLAEQMGRFSGIFNQPAEAGVAYSLAMLAILYLARVEPDRPRWLLWALLATVTIGGLLTLSKVFVIGGLVLALVLALTDRRNRRQSVPVGAAAVGLAAAAGATGLAGSWGASIMLNWYRVSIQAGDSLTYTLSAGRFGTPGDNGPAPSISPSLPVDPSDPASALPTGLSDIGREIFEHHPIVGVGARGLHVAYDSMWAEALIVGGLVGLVLMIAIHLVLFVRWLRARRAWSRATWLFAGAVVVLVLGASFGIPELTCNRGSTLLWLFLVPVIVRFRPAEQAPTVPDGLVVDGPALSRPRR